MGEPRCGLVHVESMRFLAKKGWKDCDASLTNASLTEDNRRHFAKQANEFKLQIVEMDGAEPRVIWIRNDAFPQRCLCVGSDDKVRIEKWRSALAKEPHWRVHYLEALPLADEDTDKPLCVLGCGRAPAVGFPTCCRECSMSSCVQHGTRCPQKEVLCVNGCGRLAAGGFPTCCQTCLKTSATQHGPRCNEANENPPDQRKLFPAMCFLQNVKTGGFLAVRDGVPCLQPQGDIWGILQLRGALTPVQTMRRGLIVGGVGVAAASVGAVGVAGAAVVGATARTAGAVTGGVAAVGKAAGVMTAMAAIPGAIIKAVMAGKAAVVAAGALGTAVYYSAIGVGCGIAVGSGGVVARAVAKMLNDARDPGLYVTSPFTNLQATVEQKVAAIRSPCSPDQ